MHGSGFQGKGGAVGIVIVVLFLIIAFIVCAVIVYKKKIRHNETAPLASRR
jgi:hypothetical protein